MITTILSASLATAIVLWLYRWMADATRKNIIIEQDAQLALKDKEIHALEEKMLAMCKAADDMNLKNEILLKENEKLSRRIPIVRGADGKFKSGKIISKYKNMNIYLFVKDEGYKPFEYNGLSDLKDLFKERNITIGNDAKIGA